MTNTPVHPSITAMQGATKARICRSAMSMAGHEAVRSTCHRNTNSTGASTSMVMGKGSAQPVRPPTCRPITKATRLPDKASAPSMSSDFPSALCESFSSSRIPIRKTPALMGTLARNIQRQPANSTSTAAPNVAASSPNAWLEKAMPITPPRFSGGKACAATAGEAASNMPVPMPCNTRKPKMA